MLTISYCYGQPISGVVVNGETQEEIPFVNIGLKGKNIGTVSNAKGEFQWDYLFSEVADTIIFSSVGYYKMYLSISEFKKLSITKSFVFLNPKTTLLDKIVISDKRTSLVNVGNGKGSKRKKVGFGPNDNLGREIGTVITLQKEQAFIDNVSVNIGVNKYGKIKVRLNLYKWEGDKVGRRLNNVPLYFETELSEGIWEMNIEKYGIEVTSDFFISIEYIKDMGEYGLYFTFSFNKRPTLMRETKNSDWKEITYEKKRISISINTVISY